ncbi:Nif3-like dinuclear metal center hexameric protein [Clostridium cylindrosporum]|uniref:GTP cyclohydrolase 1 type 2 homolog n=1 Tax=Clostridium cylindrosporum DSM 605 TaxID=1121307 RepID=A0A0J8DBJ6_CLOCY|nr:Nif3-like dinuclear metal center hexameric protein [Clostridium cylindrosporum]KMT21668.1 putative GTP cyclohydrolase 1 type 2 [Clostridium cylindrosporum DSM 605]
MICKDLCNLIEKKFPLNLAEDYDNVGMLLGRKDKDIKKVLVALEVTEKVIDEAIDNEIDLIITHHPLIFKPLKKITDSSYIENMILKLIENKIGLYSLHTNFDTASGGMNDILCDKLGLVDTGLLCKNKFLNLYKVVVYVPKGYEDKVRDKMMNSGAGHIGEYSHCSFNTEGIGTFKPLDGTNPFIGEAGILERVEEIKIETIVPEDKLNCLVSQMISAHPYEEVAYDIYPLKNKIDYGIGRSGYLKNKMNFIEFCNFIKEKFKLDNIIVSGDFEKTIRKIAVVGGSGSDLLTAALKSGCDCLVTGDVKHHSALDYSNMGINIIDLTHYGSEIVFKESFKDFLEKETNLNIVLSSEDKNPLKIV